MQPVPDPDTGACPFGSQYLRYWQPLSSLERQFWLDPEGLYSLDPQALLLPLATRLRAATVVDAFCGVGGAAIAFARAGKQVRAFDLEPARLPLARHNAALFGVQDRIEFRSGDALQVLDEPTSAALYLDPPWGGPEYHKLHRFPLAGFRPDGALLLRKALQASAEVLFKLPGNIDFVALRRIAEPSEVFDLCLDGVLKYYIALFRRDCATRA